jgi:hypothetical protein
MFDVLNGGRLLALATQLCRVLGVIRDSGKIAFSGAKSSVDRLEGEEFTGRV